MRLQVPPVRARVDELPRLIDLLATLSPAVARFVLDVRAQRDELPVGAGVHREPESSAKEKKEVTCMNHAVLTLVVSSNERNK